MIYRYRTGYDVNVCFLWLQMICIVNMVDDICYIFDNYVQKEFT